MTRQEVKRYLLRYRVAKRSIHRIEEQIAELRESKMSAGSPTLDAMPKGSEMSDLSSYASRLDELVSDLIREKRAAEQILVEVVQTINLLESEMEREVLTLYYVRGYRWERVCNEIGYVWRHTLRIREKAVKNLARLMDDFEQ